jgi:arsenite methyltransferase
LGRHWGYDSTEVSDLVEKIWAYQGWGPEADASDPMSNFTEKDLVRYAVEAGFDEAHVELQVDVEPGTWVVDWDRLMGTSPNPNALNVGESIAGALTEDERVRFEGVLRPRVDRGRAIVRSAFAYVRALKR